MDVTVATLIWAQWASEDYSTVRIVTSSCSLCGGCFTMKLRSKAIKGKSNEYGKTILKVPKAKKRIFLHLLDEQILGRVQKKINRNAKRMHKSGAQSLVKVEQADILKWVAHLLSSGLVGLYGKPTKGSVDASMKKYLKFPGFPHQLSQDWLCLFYTKGNKSGTMLFQEVNQLQERLGLNFRASYEPAQVLCIEKYKIHFRDSQHPSDLRVVLLVEKQTGYICNFYIYSITQVLMQAQCIPFLYIIRKLVIPFCKRNHIAQIDSSAPINEAIIEEFNELGIRLQPVSKLGGKFESGVNNKNHKEKTLRHYVKLSSLDGYTILPVSGEDNEAITFLVVFWLLVHFSSINAFILYLLEDMDYGEGFSLEEFVKLLSQEILRNNDNSSASRREETTSDEDQDTDDTECEAGAAATYSRISQKQHEVSMQKKEKGVTGLCNLGNTCYMNAVLQCLSGTTPLVEYFFSWQFEKFIAGEKKEVATVFAKLMADMWFGKEQSVSPQDFLSVMSNVHPPFGKHAQQDAQELLIYTLNALHEDLANSVKKTPSDIAGSSSRGSLASETLITRLLQGVLRHTTVCLECGNTSHKDDIFTVLSLPIASGNETSVQECLECFFQQAVLTKTDKIFCPFCKNKQDASVKAQIWKLPKILILHLKRFEYKGRLKRKLKTSVDFPLKNLDLSPFLSSFHVKQQKYKLYAVVNHFGDLDFGHYTAFCKHPGTKEWNAFDDNRTFRISDSMVQTSSAYILFYSSQTFSFPKKTSSCTTC